MREIKFRAWDGQDKLMRTVKKIMFNKNDEVDIKIEEEWFATGPDLVLMQYTNQKNHENIEIYEGDYVSKELDNGFDYGEFEGVVELIDGKWVVNNRINHYEELFTEIEQIEIIGNIYENPELLETKKSS